MGVGHKKNYFKVYKNINSGQKINKDDLFKTLMFELTQISLDLINNG